MKCIARGPVSVRLDHDKAYYKVHCDIFPDKPEDRALLNRLVQFFKDKGVPLLKDMGDFMLNVSALTDPKTKQKRRKRKPTKPLRAEKS